MIAAACLLSLIAAAGCNNDPGPAADPQTGVAMALKDVPAVRLNFRYEADVPSPSGEAVKMVEDRNTAVQSDFDTNRQQNLEQLYATFTSPDKKKVLAVYSRTGDSPDEYRLDMYTPDGKVLRRVTPDTMAVHFADTIKWSPDSSTVAFVSTVRAGKEEEGSTVAPGAEPLPEVTPEDGDPNAAASPEAAPPVAAPTPAPPPNVLTFHTEQLYICDAEGNGLKPLTQNEGYIYFYYVWAPDSSALAAMALTSNEWNVMKQFADLQGEIFVPTGRPRIIEKNGRERRLDDSVTKAHPVWSPDSAKVAVAFNIEMMQTPNAPALEKDNNFNPQIRIYDAAGTVPTQAAIPLRNQLLLSSQLFDQNLQRQQAGDNSPANTSQPNVLPDPNTLVSFNRITRVEWTAPEMLYFETGYQKLMKSEADSARSNMRWHRLVLSPQPIGK